MTLVALIQDEFANHAMQYALRFQYDRICALVINDFRTYAVHQHANHLVQCCIRQTHSQSSLLALANAFIQHAPALAAHPNHIAVVHIRRALEQSLKQAQATEKLQELQARCYCGRDVNGVMRMQCSSDTSRFCVR